MASIGKDIAEAIGLLNEGHVIGIPTETVYGLAGNAINTDAVAKIFEVKNRPSFDPLIIHTNSIDRFSAYVSEIDERAFALAEKFMPGPLTLLLPRKDIIPDLVTSGLDKVAIRIPQHPLTLELLSQLDYPLAAPSANPFGYISPTSAAHVNNQLGDKIKYILDGGTCQVGIESTIVGFEAQEAIVYRKGGLSIEEIEGVIGKVKVIDHSSSNPQAPGMLKSHYAPKKQLLLLPENQSVRNDGKKIGYLGFQHYHQEIPQQNQLLLSPDGDFREAAKHLFAYMRQLDAMDVDIIYTDLLPEKDLGRAINDRIRRATVKE
ncbi:L-threonylcarbamoyladenylate synthase [Emticicia agri]|uniref:Threonylcarbamoyl-AMP synthase n=1 Tax=Emticicia agri TaxID=2492393 RepID=A0A4Q5LVH4_9BACT|nr:L-threonylcarbamoyladenylate synthase [Emticicia agri]RYU93507.1 threonylcarbamoyl-AMP synthase [Emticicia agri]